VKSAWQAELPGWQINGMQSPSKQASFWAHATGASATVPDSLHCHLVLKSSEQVQELASQTTWAHASSLQAWSSGQTDSSIQAVPRSRQRSTARRSFRHLTCMGSHMTGRHIAFSHTKSVWQAAIVEPVPYLRQVFSVRPSSEQLSSPGTQTTSRHDPSSQAWPSGQLVGVSQPLPSTLHVSIWLEYELHR
jgi:hypothetical protein